MINITGIKASVRRWRCTGDPVFVERANKLGKFIKKWEKSGLGLQVLIDFYFSIQK